MRICIIGKFPPIQGGVSMRTYQTAHALAARDLNTRLVRGVIRQEIWQIFRQIGLVDDSKPPDPKDPPRSTIQEMLKRAGLGHLLQPPPGDRR